jgi:tyrosyl-tRNA synthetase
VQTVYAEASGIRLANLLKEAGLVSSTSEGNRKIDEGAVRIDGTKINDRGHMVIPGADHVFQVGSRRFARLKIAPKPT